MTPKEFVKQFTDTIQESKNKLTDEELKNKKVTMGQYYDSMMKFAISLNTMLDVANYKLSIKAVDEKEEEVNGIKLKCTQLEDLYILQPIKFCTAQEHQEIMDAVSRAYDKGALKNKFMLLLPYDIKILKASLQ